jgi:hypothetical protein
MQIVALGGLLLLVGVGVIVGLVFLRATPKDDRGNAKTRPVALVKAQEVVEKQFAMKVQFDENPKLREVQENEWIVESHVQYKDGLGRLWKKQFSARVRKDADSDWRVDELELGGQQAQDGRQRRPQAANGRDRLRRRSAGAHRPAARRRCQAPRDR